MTFKYGIDTLTLDTVIGISEGTIEGILTEDVKNKVIACR